MHHIAAQRGWQLRVRISEHADQAPLAAQVMGAPLAGSDVRAEVMTGGGLRLKGWLPRYRSRRLQMIFPLRGSERRGLVSLEAKRRKARPASCKRQSTSDPAASAKQLLSLASMKTMASAQDRRDCKFAAGLPKGHMQACQALLSAMLC